MSTVGKGSQYYSGFSPTSIPGCALWLDAADATTLTLSGTNVTQWNDKSGNSNHATQSTVSNRPTYSSAQTGVSFNGTTSFMNLTSGSFVVNQYFTFFVVERLQADDGNRNKHFIGTVTGGNNVGLHIRYQLATPSIRFGFFANDYDAPVGSFGFLTAATQQIRVWTFAFTPSFRGVYANGTFLGSDGNNTFLTAWATPVIGSSFNTDYYNGFLYEILGYSGNMPLSQRQQIEGHLTNKWRLAASLPAAHPYYWPQLLSAPTSVPGCALWLDAADTSTLTLSGSTVTQWRDKSGNGRHAVGNLGTGTYSSNALNSLPTIQITPTGNMVAPVPAGTFPTAITFFVVFQKTGSNNTEDVVITRTVTRFPAPFYFTTLGTNTADRLIGSGTGFSALRNTDVVTRLTTPTILSVSLTSSSSNWAESVNGTLITYSITPYSEGVSNYTDNASNIHIGTRGDGNAQMNGNISEIICYSSALTTFQRQQIEGYLAAKWGLTASLPASHPQLRVIARPLSLRPFSPLDISECVMWFDAADASTFTFSSGSNISVWSNKSSRTDSIATWDSVAVLVSPGTLGNGVPNVRFSNYAYTSNALGYGGATGETIFMVGNNSSTTQYLGVTRWSNNAWNGSHVLNLRSDAVRPEIQGVGGINITGLPARTKLAVGVVNATTLNAFESGTAGATNPLTIALNQANANIRWGSGGGIPNDVGELLYYNKALTTEERQRVEGYLVDKWGLRGNIPSTHPFKLASALSVPFNPVQLPGCAFWLDAADSTTITLTGTTLTGWTDKSGNGRSVTIDSAPSYSSNGFNNRPCMTFALGNRLTSSTASAVGQNATIAAVYRITGTGTANNHPVSAIMGLGVVGSDYNLHWRGDFNTYAINSTGGGTGNDFYTAININMAAVGVMNTATPYWVLTLNGSNKVNGNIGGYNTVPPTLTSAQVNIGSGNWGNGLFVGNLCEVLVFSTSLTISQRQQLEGYLTWKWGVRQNLPTTHPYSKFNPS